MIRVYHNPKTDFFTAVDSHVYCMTPAELVAEVQTNDLEEAYMLTNHIDSSWYKHPLVKCIRESRSTSVGDVMERNGKWFVVDKVGFKEVR